MARQRARRRRRPLSPRVRHQQREYRPPRGGLDLSHRRNGSAIRHEQGDGVRSDADCRGRHDVRRHAARPRHRRRSGNRRRAMGVRSQDRPRYFVRRFRQPRCLHVDRWHPSRRGDVPPPHLCRDGPIAAVCPRRARRPAVFGVREERHGGPEGRPAHSTRRSPVVLDDLAAACRERRCRHRLVDRRQHPAG